MESTICGVLLSSTSEIMVDEMLVLGIMVWPVAFPNPRAHASGMEPLAVPRASQRRKIEVAKQQVKLGSDMVREQAEMAGS